MVNKSPKRMPEVPSKFKDLEEVNVFLRDLLGALDTVHQRTVEGPLNKVPFIVEQYDDLRNINAGTISAANLADVVATLIIVLQKGGVLK
jgi:hypothetical protein